MRGLIICTSHETISLSHKIETPNAFLPIMVGPNEKYPPEISDAQFLISTFTHNFLEPTKANSTFRIIHINTSKIMIYFTLALALASGVHAYEEFGLRKLNNRNAHDRDDVMRRLLELEQSLLVDFSMSMSLSMSMDYSAPTFSLSPISPLLTVAPLATPTSAPFVSFPPITMSPSDYVYPTPASTVVPSFARVDPLATATLAPTFLDEQPLIANVDVSTGSNGSKHWILGTCLGVLGGVSLALMALVTKKRLDHLDANKKELQDGESSAETSIDHGDDILTGTTAPDLPADTVENA